MRNAKETADSHVAAFNAHDPKAHAANETSDIEWIQPGGITLRGPEQVIASQRLFWDAFPDARVDPVNQIVADPFVVTEGTFSGTNTGTLRTPNGDVPPTGKAIKLPFITVQRIEKGLIASEHLYYDQAEMLAQLGLLPS